MNFSNVKSWTIPEGNVKKVTLNGVDIWQKESAPPVDKYSWEAVIASVNAGTYRNDYSIGDLIPLDLGTEGQLNAQIADFDHDDLANENGKAPITFITKELCATTSNMNSSRTNVGGWRDSLMRNTIMPSIWNKLPTILQESIVEVVKKSSAGNTDTTIVSTNDKLWIPSLYEVNSSRTDSPYGDEGTTYPIFTDDSSRIKTINGSAQVWWLRSPNKSNDSRFFGVNATGATASGTAQYAEQTHGVAVGFCIGRTTSN